MTSHLNPLAAVFIPSRDRALQLDGTLRSFERHCTDHETTQISVLFRATTTTHRRAYRKLAREHAGVRMIEERSFSRDATRLLGGATSGRRFSWGDPERQECEAQLLVVDDAMFVSPFSIQSMTRALSALPEALGFSLRLGETIRFCQPLGIDSPPPEFHHVSDSAAGEIVSFSWRGLEPDWGYPLELSSSMYRKSELTGLLRGTTFRSPTTLEHELWLASKTLDGRHGRLLCHRRPKAVSLALNRVQDIAPNPVSGHRRHETPQLVARFLEGWRIDVGAYDGYVPHACHEEAELILSWGSRCP